MTGDRRRRLSTYLVAVQMEGMITVIEIVDDHVGDRDVVNGRDELRSLVVCRTRGRRVPQVGVQA